MQGADALQLIVYTAVEDWDPDHGDTARQDDALADHATGAASSAAAQFRAAGLEPAQQRWVVGLLAQSQHGTGVTVTRIHHMLRLAFPATGSDAGGGSAQAPYRLSELELSQCMRALNRSGLVELDPESGTYRTAQSAASQ